MNDVSSTRFIVLIKRQLTPVFPKINFLIDLVRFTRNYRNMNSLELDISNTVLDIAKPIENGLSENSSCPTVTKLALDINMSSSTLIMDVDNESVKLQSSTIASEIYESSSTLETVQSIETIQDVTWSSVTIDKEDLKKESALNNSYRHGISRYAPYGTRFAAQMKDGSYRTSHIAGDLANRARQKGGKGGRVDLVLVTHEGERNQLDSALRFYETCAKRSGPNPGPSEVLNHLKAFKMDWDYRKGDGVKLLQRNASNFFKRMMEHARRVSHPVADHYALPPPPKSAAVDVEVSMAAAILESLKYASNYETESDQEMQVDEDVSSSNEVETSSKVESDRPVTVKIVSSKPKGKREVDWSLPQHHQGSFYYEICRHSVVAREEETRFYSKAAETFDWSTVEDVTAAHKPSTKAKHSERFDYDTEVSEEYYVPRTKKQKIRPQVTPRQPRPAPKQFTSTGSVPSTAAPVVRKGREGLSAGNFLKGLSRHSPYGTRFCAQMPNGEMRESYLAGDLAERVRSGTGKGQGELLLVLHAGEIQQLQTAWEFVRAQEPNQIGAGVVLEELRMLGLDINHRKPGSKLLQKNAGNFFKRVQEYGRRKSVDPTYLAMENLEDAAKASNEESQAIAAAQSASAAEEPIQPDVNMDEAENPFLSTGEEFFGQNLDQSSSPEADIIADESQVDYCPEEEPQAILL